MVQQLVYSLEDIDKNGTTEKNLENRKVILDYIIKDTDKILVVTPKEEAKQIV